MNPDPTSLDRLHDIIAAPPAPWWPPAPGWLWLAGMALVFLVAGVALGFARWQRNRYRREALAEWKQQCVRIEDPQTRGPALGELAILLKRAALSAFPRAEVASLTGPAWLALLDRTAATRDFSSGPGALLERAAYDTCAEPDLQQSRAAAELVRHWLLRHKTEEGGAAC